jgi:hypothetical protein
MDMLNSLQLISAHENVYFDTDELGQWLLASAPGVGPIREANKARLTVAVDIDDDRSELLHQYRPMPQLGLQLSFVSTRRSALDIPLDKRPRQVRGPYRSETLGGGSPSNVRHFEVKSHHHSE